MPGWSETDLEATFADAFANDGPLVYNGQSVGCVVKQYDTQASGLGERDLVDRVVEVSYPTFAFGFVSPPTIGSQVTVAGVTYYVRHKMDKPAGVSCLYLAQTP